MDKTTAIIILKCYADASQLRFSERDEELKITSYPRGIKKTDPSITLVIDAAPALGAKDVSTENILGTPTTPVSVYGQDAIVVGQALKAAGVDFIGSRHMPDNGLTR